MSVLTRREILTTIVENPGWEPPESSAVAQHVEELHDRGFIVPRRRGGWEATPKAIDNYPHFYDWPELRDPSSPASAQQSALRPPRPETVPIDRVTCLLVGLLRELPLITVYSLVASPAQRYPQGPEWEIAQKLAESMT